jgi:hypothetical protein
MYLKLNYKPPVSHYSAIDFSSFAYNKPQSHLLLYKPLSSNARRKTSGGRLKRADIARAEKKKDLVYGNKTTESQSARRTNVMMTSILESIVGLSQVYVNE